MIEGTTDEGIELLLSPFNFSFLPFFPSPSLSNLCFDLFWRIIFPFHHFHHHLPLFIIGSSFPALHPQLSISISSFQSLHPQLSISISSFQSLHPQLSISISSFQSLHPQLFRLQFMIGLVIKRQRKFIRKKTFHFQVRIFLSIIYFR